MEDAVQIAPQTVRLRDVAAVRCSPHGAPRSADETAKPDANHERDPCREASDCNGLQR